VNLIFWCTPIQQRLGFLNAMITLTGHDVFTSRNLLATKLFERVKERQDRWFRNSRSMTGAITFETAVDIVDWATTLDLLFATTLSWKPYARIIDALITQEEYNALLGTGTHNLLELSLPSRVFYLYLLLKLDGAALIYLLSAMRDKSKWTRKDAGQVLPEIYKKYGELLGSSASSNVEHAEARKFTHIAQSMIEHTREGVVGTRELRVTPRIETLVDLHILEKPHDKRDSYVYRNTDKTGRFLRNFPDWGDDPTELDSTFFGRCAHVYGIQGTGAEEEVIFRTMMKNFEPLRASYGLAGIDEVCLLSGIDLLTSRTPMISEVSTSRGILLEKQTRFQDEIKLYVDSRGGIRYFSVTRNFLERFGRRT